MLLSCIPALFHKPLEAAILTIKTQLFFSRANDLNPTETFLSSAVKAKRAVKAKQASKRRARRTEQHAEIGVRGGKKPKLKPAETFLSRAV